MYPYNIQERLGIPALKDAGTMVVSNIETAQRALCDMDRYLALHYDFLPYDEDESPRDLVDELCGILRQLCLEMVYQDLPFTPAMMVGTVLDAVMLVVNSALSPFYEETAEKLKADSAA